MKTAISIPDEIFAEAEKAAKRLGLSRSELFTRAIRAYLNERSERSITSSYNAAFDDASSAKDDFQREAARRALLSVEWDSE
jgi:metal-responsive CopG/Arc/MetJ family transcriptional regulator